MLNRPLSVARFVGLLAVSFSAVSSAGVMVAPESVKFSYTAVVKVPKSAFQSDNFDFAIAPQTVENAAVRFENRTEVGVMLPDLEEAASVSFAAVDKDGKLIHELASIKIADVPPPVPPVPPTPPTPPVPPTPPTPPPSPAPIPDAGFRVLIVYESGEMTKYPIETQVILAGADVREFLGKNCISGANGVPEYRIYDADVDTKNDSPVWQKAMARPRTSLPWVIISNGKTGYEGPLPKTPTEFLELCKKHIPTK